MVKIRIRMTLLKVVKMKIRIDNVFKVVEGKENQACLIYAHGGGAVALSADM